MTGPLLFHADIDFEGAVLGTEGDRDNRGSFRPEDAVILSNNHRRRRDADGALNKLVGYITRDDVGKFPDHAVDSLPTFVVIVEDDPRFFQKLVRKQARQPEGDNTRIITGNSENPGDFPAMAQLVLQNISRTRGYSEPEHIPEKTDCRMEKQVDNICIHGIPGFNRLRRLHAAGIISSLH